MKNASSKRTMSFNSRNKRSLAETQRTARQNKAYFKNGYNQQFLEYVWVDDLGKLINPNTVTHHFKTFLAQNGLPHIRFHELRHSCASLLIACGVSLKEIQEWLGHSAISTTADIYSHLNYSSKLNVASTLTNIFGGGTLDVKAQNTSEAQALPTTLFRGAEHEQAAQTTIAQIEETPPDEDADEQDEEIVQEQTATSESDSVAEYKKAKAEMARLGFETLDEYFDYVEFMEVKAKRNYATT